MTLISEKTHENIAWFQKECCCFDLTIRSISTDSADYVLLFLGGITTSSSVEPLIQGLITALDLRVFLNASVCSVQTLDEAYELMLQGQTAVFVMNQALCYVVDTRAYPGRVTSEPTVEKSIRGARDGFVELLMVNIGLIRKRLRAKDLCIEKATFGTQSCTDVALFYLDHVVQRDVLDDLKRRLSRVPSSINLQSERELADLLYPQWYNPYPHVRFTERPDLVCIHLLQGQIAIVVDHCPTAMLVPLTLFECTSQIEEVTQPRLISMMLRFLRTLGLFICVFLVPVWICTLDFETLGELVLCHECKLVTVVVPVVIPSAIEVIELPLRPRQRVIYICLSPSVAISKIQLNSPRPSLSRLVAVFPIRQRREDSISSRILNQVVHMLVPALYIKVHSRRDVRIQTGSDLS